MNEINIKLTIEAGDGFKIEKLSEEEWIEGYNDFKAEADKLKHIITKDELFDEDEEDEYYDDTPDDDGDDYEGEQEVKVDLSWKEFAERLLKIPNCQTYKGRVREDENGCIVFYDENGCMVFYLDADKEWHEDIKKLVVGENNE